MRELIKVFNKRNIFAVIRTRAMGVENMVTQYMKNLRSTEYNVYPIFKCNRDFWAISVIHFLEA